MYTTKAVVKVTISIVVGGVVGHTIGDSIDNFLERALCSNIPISLYPEGLVDTHHIDTEIIHEWEE